MSGKIDQEKKLLNAWRHSPLKFIYEGLRIKDKGFDLTTQQKEAVEEVRRLVEAKFKSGIGKELTEEESLYASKMGISIQSGKGTGKDCLAAMMIIWFIACFPNPKIPCTANSGKQLKEVLWSEVKKWLKDTPIEDWLVVQAEKIYMKLPKKEDCGKRWFATARTVNAKSTPDEQIETLQGFHEDYMMIVVDEASGIPDPVFKPFETTLTGLVNFVFMIFNPMRATGYAMDSQTKYRKDWVCLHWDAEDSELSDMPQFKAQIQRLEDKYGRDSNVFRINVKGLPPLSDSDTLIPWDWVMNAVDKEVELCEDDPVKMSLDVGAGGDASILLKRQGPKVFPCQQNNTKNTMELTGWASTEMASQDPSITFVDVIGLGNGVLYRLRELGHNVMAVDVRNTPRKPERFHRLRDELWWLLREEFEEGTISIPNDDELIGELSTIKYSEESSGKVKIEGKKELKQRGLPSPNRADALMQTKMMPDSVYRQATKKAWYQSSHKEPQSMGWQGA